MNFHLRIAALVALLLPPRVHAQEGKVLPLGFHRLSLTVEARSAARLLLCAGQSEDGAHASGVRLPWAWRHGLRGGGRLPCIGIGLKRSRCVCKV